MLRQAGILMHVCYFKFPLQSTVLSGHPSLSLITMKIFSSSHRVPGVASGVEKLPTRQSKGLQEMRPVYLAYGLENLSLSVWYTFKEAPSMWSGVLFALTLQYFLEKK